VGCILLLFVGGCVASAVLPVIEALLELLAYIFF